jgi:uncharacterized membrane protein YqjE
MPTVPGTFAQLSAASKRFAQRVLIIGENRLELLLVEVQEERDRLLRAILLALGTAAFGLLAGVALTLGIAVLLWEHSPGLTLLVLTFIYVGIAVFLFTRLARLQKNWQPLPATLEQLKKDCKCLEQNLS